MKATFGNPNDETICFHMLLSTDRPNDELEHGNLKSERSWPSGCKL